MTMVRRSSKNLGQPLKPLNSEGLEFKVAETLGEIRSVFDFAASVYEEFGLVDPSGLEQGNEKIIEGAMKGNAVIIYAIGRDSGEIELSVSSVVGRLDQLPIFETIKTDYEILENLEKRGVLLNSEKVWEIGRLAHSRRNKDTLAIGELFRGTYYFGNFAGATDLVTVVNPETSKFHKRVHGFDSVGFLNKTGYKKGGDVLWFNYGDVTSKAKWTGKPRGIRKCLENPLELDYFKNRYGASGLQSEESLIA